MSTTLPNKKTFVHCTLYTVHFLLALAPAFLAPWTETSSMIATLCRELLAGTNEGRQALLGSALEGPLGALVTLPWQVFFPATIAVRLGAATGWFLALLAGARSFKNDPETPSFYILHSTFYILLASAIFASGAGANPQAAVLAACGFYAFRCGTHWVQHQRMRDLIGLGAGLAGLTLCGLAGWCVAFAAFWFMPVGAIRAPEKNDVPPSSRPSAFSLQPSAFSLQPSPFTRRLPAVLLLGLLPMFYAFGVWMLMNRLVFGDALFFLRPLGHSALAELMPMYARFIIGTPLSLTLISCALALFCGNASHVVAGVLLLLAVLAASTLNKMGIHWITPGLVAAIFISSTWLLFSLKLAQKTPPATLFIYFSACLFIGCVQTLPRYPRGLGRECLSEILSEIQSRTPYGCLFVCGYSGLALLENQTTGGDAAPPVRPNLDLHIGQLRRDYHGQDLFILIPAPEGRGAADAVQRTHGTAAALARERAMLVDMQIPAWGGAKWTLYEIVGAPTQKQFDEWERE